jgi:hypothetical protein
MHLGKIADSFGRNSLLPFKWKAATLFSEIEMMARN